MIKEHKMMKEHKMLKEHKMIIEDWEITVERQWDMVKD